MLSLLMWFIVFKIVAAVVLQKYKIFFKCNFTHFMLILTQKDKKVMINWHDALSWKQFWAVLSIFSARSPGNPQLFRMYVPDELSSLLGSMCCIAFPLDGLLNDSGLNKWLQTILKTCTPGKVIKRKLTLMQGFYNRDQESHQVSRPTKEFVCMKSLTEWHAGKQKKSRKWT